MSDLSFDINGDPLPKSNSPTKKGSSAGIRVIRTPSPSNLATTTVTHKRHSSSSASSHSGDKSVHLVAGPTGTVVGDLRSDTVATIDRASSTSPHRYSTAGRGSPPADSKLSTKLYRITGDRQNSPAQDLQSDVVGSIVDKARNKQRSKDSMRKSARLVADPTGTVVEDLKADTTSFIPSSQNRDRHRDRRAIQHSSSNSDSSKSSYRIVKIPKKIAPEDLRFDVNGSVINEQTQHHHKRHPQTRSSGLHSSGHWEKAAAPLLPSRPSSPAALYDAVFGEKNEPVRTDERASSSSSATSISSGYIQAAGETRRTRRRGFRA